MSMAGVLTDFDCLIKNCVAKQSLLNTPLNQWGLGILFCHGSIN